ncbi:MAG TPA: TetR/AcrR family transcriptional regulator [Acidimicrobiales bacterium]|nr:TetR/AcrR family transcriptional regulator [Acidimicrobiales bacterium]
MEPTDATRRAPFAANPRVGERGASTQRRILAAALDVFAEHGFHDASVELIAEAAGCSRPAFYQYFSSKEDVFFRLANDLAAGMGRLGDELGTVAADASGVDHLRSWLGDLADLQATYAPVFMVFQVATRDEARTRRASRGISRRMGEAILQGLGPRPGVAVDALGSTVTTIVLRTVHYWQSGIARLPRQRFLDGLAQTLHRLLHGPLPGVNVGPPVDAARRPAPRWPDLPDPGNGAASLRRRGQETRRKLLEAGSAVLPRRGYHETRVDDIVTEAHVSHGSFYRYFESKDHLFHVLADEAAAAMADLVTGFPDDVGSDELHAWLAGWFATYRRNGAVISLWQEIDYADVDLAPFSVEIARVVIDRLTRILARRGFGDARLDATVLLSVVERVPYSVLVLRYVEEGEAVDAATFFIRRGLFGLGGAGN